jgi:hypothetical protein
LLETANAAHLVFVCISAAKSREVTVILNREILQAQCSSAAQRLNTISTPTGNREQDGSVAALAAAACPAAQPAGPDIISALIAVFRVLSYVVA